MAKPNLRLVTPTTEDRTVTPRRAPNTQLRSREHLTADEVENVIEAIKQNRYGHCDAVMVLLAFRHGLRAAEVVDLRWEQVDFKTASLHIRRTKNGTPATHPLSGREMRELRGVLLILVAGVTLPATTAHAEECLAAPTSPAREGTRWRYRLNWATQHKCWYMREIDQPTQQTSGHAESAPPAPALATTIPQAGPATTGSAFSVRRGNPAPSSTNREEIDTKSTAAPPLGGPTLDTTSSIPKEFASQRARTSLAAPATNTAPGIGAATDEITSAISDMHQAAPTTIVAPYAERLGRATTDETGSPTSDLAVPPQAASSSELNAQMAAMAPHESAAPTDERVDNAGRCVSALYFIVAFLLALVVQLLMPALAAATHGFSKR